jgi:peptide methionine sulfoxide reductase MsrA
MLSLQLKKNTESVFDGGHRAGRDHSPTLSEAIFGHGTNILTFDETPLSDSSLRRLYWNMQRNPTASGGQRQDNYKSCRAVVEWVGGHN